MRFTVSTYRAPEPITCPTCLASLTGLTHVAVSGKGGLAIPDPGDRTICGYCGTLLVYVTGDEVRKATVDEEVECAMDPRMQLCREMVNAARLDRYE